MKKLQTVIMVLEDERAVKVFKRILRKNPDYKLFLASKFGNNNKGKGVDRSVILGSQDGKIWYQAHKVWGSNNEERARQIIKCLKNNLI